MNGLILLVEDNEQILSGNERMLKRRGYGVMTALTLAVARERMNEAEPDMVVLDIMLPDGSGLDFMREIRQSSNIPILLLTGLTTPEDVVRGLTEGGDDYLTKPYDFGVLLARIEALLNGEDLLLTQKDFALLFLFMQKEDKVMSAEYLYEKVWKAPLIENTFALKNAVSRLRKKLAGSRYTISATRGEGYLFKLE